MKKNFFNLKNKNIIITGGSGFLGGQITGSLLNEKANVYIIDVKEPKNTSSAKYFKSDISNEQDLKKILKFFKLKKIKIDVLINNAAIDYPPLKSKKNIFKLETFPNNLWDKDISVSLKGSYLCTKIFGSYMSKFKKGSIINVSSDLGIIAPDQRIYKKSGFTKPITYSVVKHGMLGLTRYFATLYSKYNVQVNMLSPGPIKNKHTKTSGFTNNPKYFGKKPLESSSSSEERKSYSLKGKRKFKNRSNRPKQFTFKNYNKKRKKF